jgi:bifunctional DNA-binding transcriptional regulator/antitoxin component of YhaV-PrlF toxin-antitoxin module
MTTKYTVTLTSVGSSSVIAVPKPIVDGFGLQKGEKLEMFVSDNGMYIPLKAKPIDNPMIESIETEIQRQTKPKKIEKMESPKSRIISERKA